MDNWFFWGGLAALGAVFIIAAIIKKKRSANRKSDDPSDIYPMW